MVRIFRHNAIQVLDRTDKTVNEIFFRGYRIDDQIDILRG